VLAKWPSCVKKPRLIGETADMSCGDEENIRSDGPRRGHSLVIRENVRQDAGPFHWKQNFMRSSEEQYGTWRLKCTASADSTSVRSFR
jgi:hypothetical protein